MRVTWWNRRFALILFGALVIVAGAFATHRSEAQTTPESVTVSLVEGWNLVGWTGNDTSLLAATADIAYRFDDLRTFDPESGTMLRFRNGIAPDRNSLSELRYATGVWVHVATRSRHR